jgi:hypothetical protein
LWLCERHRRLIRIATISVDKALDGWRDGHDLVLSTVETIRASLTKGEILVPAMSSELPECPV